jgi:hypothetical protein
MDRIYSFNETLEDESNYSFLFNETLEDENSFSLMDRIYSFNDIFWMIFINFNIDFLFWT